MPPKNQSKSIEDKTFGMKNKNKSKKVQQYVQHLQAQASKGGSKAEQDALRLKEAKAASKRAEDEKKKEIQSLFTQAVIQPKVPFGTDPKTILCAHFKVGQCSKSADRCKFSHDLNVSRKVEKKNLYQDDEKDKNETMENWSQDQLQNAIDQNESGRVNLNRATDIVCKFFIEAIELSKYGWFWECPNGKDCKYRHALPPGFVLKKKETEEERREREAKEKSNQITLEDFLEKQRHSLGPNTTMVTAATFAAWKKDRVAKKEKQERETRSAKADAMAKLKAGLKNTGMVFSGRDMFEFNPQWAAAGDDEDEEDGMDLDEMIREKRRRDDVEEDAVMASMGGSVESLQIDE